MPSLGMQIGRLVSEHRFILDSHEGNRLSVFTSLLITIYRPGFFHLLTQHSHPASMFPVSRTNKQRAESVIQDTRGNNVKNVSGENLSRNKYFV